jgi:hypothetical protein
MIIEEKHKFFTNKKTWIALLLLLLTISPLLLWLFNQYPADPIGEFIGFKVNRFYNPLDTWTKFSGYFLDLPYSYGWALLIMFLFGSALYFSELIFGYDLIFKPERKDLRWKLFILVFILFCLISWGFNRPAVEQRDNFTIMLFVFCISAYGILKIQNSLKKYSKPISIIFILIIIGFIAYYHISWGVQLTEVKSNDAYGALKSAGLWLNQNTQPTDIIYTNGVKEIMYYSQRQVLDPNDKDYGIPKNQSEAENELINNKQIKYIELDVVERAPDWFYTWVQQNNQTFVPVNAWFADAQKTQPIVIVYKRIA